MDLNATAPGLASRFYYPGILGAIEAILVLAHDGLELLEKCFDVLFSILWSHVFHHLIGFQQLQIPWTSGEVLVVLAIQQEVVDVVADEVEVVVLARNKHLLVGL